MQKARRLLPSLLVLLGVLISTQALATVVQVDGTVVPTTDGGSGCDGNIQVCLNDSEGDNNIDAITDAATEPEVFFPNTTQPVEFRDVGEGAGFENSFGYYNIGDDVTDVSNLHPILGCGVEASDHSGEANGYVENAEPGDTTTVDFAAEETAGRYKGGAIGFYLITPEISNGSRGSPNCGDFETSGGDAYFGRMYFTQRDLNNDGDFVHHLVYQSNQAEDRFYFGFEDLFRGGDNDFEDMLIRVTGLTPPCVPEPEICDGLDNDCDNQIDEEDSLVDTGNECTDTSAFGICQQGETLCVDGDLECASVVPPEDEVCDNIDNDCDGTIDNSPTDAGGSCDSGDNDLCTDDVEQCVSGALVCTDDPPQNTPSEFVEVCDDFDNDCDGSVDEGTDGDSCDGSDGDLCAEGVTVCDGGTFTCSDDTGTNQELCDGVDNDCDSTTDESPVDAGEACSRGVGACLRNGATECVSGELTCNASAGTPSTETCNSVDDDCDGSIDEDFNLGADCVAPGACGAGVIECFNGGSICSTAPGSSNDQSSPETCNGIDDDCDGSTDEGLTDLGECGTDTGECSTGVLQCVGGEEQCRGATDGSPEICDGLDNDCDGTADNNLTDTGERCSDSGKFDIGACVAGQTACVDGNIECQNQTGPSEETCNAEDDDCDGSIDEEPSDVGEECVKGDGAPSNVGVCQPGETICVNGSIQCNGDVGPGTEVCNGEDDDCNGEVDDDPVDAGRVCGSGLGTCEPGVLTCNAEGELECDGATQGEEEVCNGIDDDCDNVVDEDPSDAGAECGNDVGVCEMGAERCISGELECVGGTLPGTEVCNGLDDDCNGEIDDGELCEGGICTDGRCSNPCDPNAEFPCPPGQMCSSGGFCVPDPCFEVECEPMEDGTGTRCVEGDCIPICDVPSMSCPDPHVCRRTDGACVGNNCTYLPYLCDETQVCRAGECVEDRCRDVTCDDGQFCRDGECVGSCAGVTCEGSERCQDGECVATGCDAPCGNREVCDASSGECVDDPCRAIVCGESQSCDPQTGTCTTDPCLGIECPEKQVCRMGQCLAEDGPVGGTGGSSGAGGAGGGGVDAGTRVDVVATGGGGFGCSVAARGGGDGAATCPWLALSSLALLALRRRRARSSRQGALHRAGLFTLAIGTLAAAQPGCSVDPFCVDNCGDGDGIDRGDGGPGGAGMGGGSGMGGSGADGGAGFGGSVGDAGECEPTLVDDENCNGRDDDCDGLVDESFKLQEDPANCGACGNSCAKPGAQTVCDQGTCVIMGCFGGYVDLNDDTMNVDDFDGSDGCEYECFTSNQGEEVCDELDNDCDGTVDEGTDLQTDPQNCGQCGRTCEFFHASGRCAEGSCTFDPMVDCDPGFVDANGVEFDGCEFECEPTNEGEEICDSIDNDCDGMVDEDFNLDSNPDRCGACDRTCEFPNATPQCTDGECGFDPTTDCEAGYSDTDGNQINGCEDDCIPTDDPTEICDGVDNDCDGTIDGDTTDSGEACHLAPGDTAAGACTSTGTITCVNSEDEEGDLIGELKCVGAPEPTTEICNGADDDCDGTIDETPSDEGRVCQPPEGICSAGFTACDTASGELDCVRDIGPQAETCNGVDDDCDGTIDNNLTDASLGTSCGTNEGPCSAGTVECVDGALVCEGAVFGGAETCNGVDDDCNGSVDDNPIDEGGSCGSNVGACVPGSLICSGGGLVCDGGVQSSSEICNGSDDDCDGAVDENAGGSGPLTRSCYTGPSGTEDEPFCHGGTQACTDGEWGACADEQTPVDETCDGDDTDCDGTIDENITRSCYTGPDGTRGVGICTAGTETCSAGSFGSCEGEVLPEATESCDGEDDDCDEAVDENDAGTGPLTRDCYTGPDGTEDVGTCQGGTQTCRVGAFRDCIGEITPVTDVCGDGADTDCDGDGDAAEGCATEETDQRLDDSGAHSFDVRMAVAGSPHGKHVYVVWVDRASGEPDIYFSRSTDGGGNFTNPRNLTNSDSSSDIGDFSHSAVQPRIAAAYDPGLGDDRVYIAFQLVDGNDNRHVRIGYSSDSGGTFADSGYLDQSNGTDNFKHELAIGVEGEHVALVWERLDLSDLDRNVVVRASEDAGNSWTDEQVVNDGSGSDPVAGKPRVGMTSGNRVVIAWREVRAPDSTFDVFARYGDFDGSSLLSMSSELQVSEDSGDNRESDDLQMRVSGSHVYLVWQDLSTGGSGGFDQDSDIVFARSTDGGAAYGGEVILDDPGNEVSSSFAPTLAVDGGSPDRVFVAWVDTRLGSQIFFTGSSDDGASFTTPVRASSDAGQPISGSTRAPRMAFAGGDMIVIAYENGPTGSPSHIYAAQSIDGGMSWHYDDPQLDTGAGPAITPAIGAIDDGSATTGAAVSWVDYRRNGSDGDIYGARAVR